ncbi:uncharacterized protein LOC115282994 [Suricata suricatta]|uniref:uncharacterized protein LOC115282994 n=1 Tax=Suricata suricatta TaxID=37032 RepID=UPI001155DE74|nr:uncharacterized protein LOC115282994 [Suricata suricatta]
MCRHQQETPVRPGSTGHTRRARALPAPSDGSHAYPAGGAGAEPSSGRAPAVQPAKGRPAGAGWASQELQADGGIWGSGPGVTATHPDPPAWVWSITFQFVSQKTKRLASASQALQGRGATVRRGRSRTCRRSRGRRPPPESPRSDHICKDTVLWFSLEGDTRGLCAVPVAAHSAHLLLSCFLACSRCWALRPGSSQRDAGSGTGWPEL